MKLSLIAEMPVNRHQILTPAPTATSQGRKTGQGFAGYLPHTSYGGFTNPLLMKSVSEKLSRLIKHNINIFVIDLSNPQIKAKTAEFGGSPLGLKWLAHVSNAPINELQNAINFVITGNNRQPAMSAWMYIHQFAEALFNEHFAEDDPFTKQFSELQQLIGRDWPKQLLKMGSARKGEFVDTVAELITEYLWHGGRIRLNQLPDPNLNAKVAAIFDEIKAIIEQTLIKSTGLVCWNDVGAT